MNNLKFAEGEITIYCGVNAMSNCTASLEQARAVARSGRAGKILYLNTFLSTRKIMAAARTLTLNPSSGVSGEGNVIFENVGIGDLAGELWRLQRIIKEQKIKTVIINSWEFAHRSYIYKERAFFEIKPVQAGKIQRGGLGKLSGLANEIITLEIEQASPLVTPVVLQTDKNVRPTDTQNEKLVVRKINELEYARSESGVSSGGELILPGAEVESEVHDEDLVIA